MRDFRFSGIDSVELADHLATTKLPGEDVDPTPIHAWQHGLGLGYNL
jgi:hypothetical protein